ncbi:MAG: DNA mismatch repair endonuclease MutL [Crocinitomicaceae bacterium]|nr:DNA mismatch repair endonuclease MutL [Crocinitomicaceae bacterium]
MKDLIQLLPDNIANQIAAGEVIQRPASVVKELLENAIDAGADKIDVNIKEAGKTLIQIVDNGSGMSKGDAVLCFQRHATSKVRTAEDLFSLTTKGFRGEALASIAAIAHVTMNTRLSSNDVGNSICVEGSEIIKNEECTCPIGTSFEVKNLFYNVPARRNFLKKESTEFKHIQDEFDRIAMAHPEIHLTLKHNGNEIYNLPSAILRKRIVNVLGNGSNDKLVPIEEKTEIVSLKGFVLKPEHARKTRGEQFFFVNDRYFKSPYFNHAITKAFEGLVKSGSFPGYFLYLDVDTRKIDVNVHPTKTEIKFEEEKFIYSILLSSIRLALGKYNIAPTLEFERETSFDIPHSMRSQPAIEPTINVDTEFNPFKTTSKPASGSSGSGKAKDNFSKAIVSHGFGQDTAKTKDWENFYPVEEEQKQQEVSPEIELEDVSTNLSSFIVKGSYIISPSKSGLMLIHARRAIEQIVYTDISKSFISNPISSQSLLFPIEKEISKNELSIWENNASLLKQLGFEGTVSKGILSLTAVPSVLQEETISKSIDDLFATIAYQDIDKGAIAHSLIGSIATSASMKKLSLSNNEAVQALIDQLFQCENHVYSPRNKKIIETLSFEEIQQKFS